MIPLDNRNPFAAWGHEEVKYSAVDSDTSVALGQARFKSNLIEDYMKNEIAENAEFVVKTTINGMPEAFDSNNDATVYPNVATNAYGMDNELQPVREPGETLDYYGIQGADLEKYNDGQSYTITGKYVYFYANKEENALLCEFKKEENSNKYYKVFASEIYPQKVGETFYINETITEDNNYVVFDVDGQDTGERLKIYDGYAKFVLNSTNSEGQQIGSGTHTITTINSINYLLIRNYNKIVENTIDLEKGNMIIVSGLTAGYCYDLNNNQIPVYYIQQDR